MIFFNQNNYSGVPYPSKEKPNATIKTSGCGVCCAANVLAFFGINGYAPPVIAKVFIARGARLNGGTDMLAAAKIISEIGDIAFRATNSADELLAHLQSGGIAIANVDGDQGEKGIFSNAGHYINVINSAETKLEIFDVGYYSGKFSSDYRRKFVSIKQDIFGNFLQICDKTALEIDTKGRNPSYYLFSKRGATAMNKDEAKAIVKEKCKLSDSTIQYIADDYRWGDELIIKLAMAMK